MEIDLFTLIAQIVNFLILVYLLKRFLYGPIIDTMEEREQKIARRYEEAEQMRAVAEQETQRYRQERLAFEQQRERLISEVQQEVDANREVWLQDAKESVNQAKQAWLQSLHQDQEDFVRQLKLEISEHTRKISRRAVEDLANKELEVAMTEVFLRRLGQLEGPEKEEFAKAVRKGGGQITVQTAFPLPEQVRPRLIEALQASLELDRAITVKFDTEPEIIAGLELATNGHQLSWTVSDYLDGLEEQVTLMVETRTRQHEADEQAERI